jgi:hypothetical protein
MMSWEPFDILLQRQAPKGWKMIREISRDRYEIITDNGLSAVVAMSVATYLTAGPLRCMAPG